MIDHEDNVARCPTCGWELQEHGWCGRCGQALDTDDEIHSMTNLTDSESYDSEEDVVDDLHPNDRDMWDQSIDLHANGLPIIMHNGGIRIVGANPQALLRRGHSTQSIPDRRRRESLPSAISVTSTDESLGSEEDDGDTDLDGFIEDDHTDTDINNDGHDDSSDGTSPIYLGVHQYGPSTVTIDSEDDESDENTTIRSEGSRTESAEESNSDGEPQNDMVSEDELSSDSSLASVPQNRRSKRPRVLEDDEEDSENDTDSDVARSRSRRRLTAHIT